MPRPQKHHYIPEFYLRQWCGKDRRLCEFSRPWVRVKPRRTHPGGTGYERGLYSLDGVPTDVQDVFETKFLSVADGQAAQILRMMIEEQRVPTGNMKAPWTRFIMSLWFRTPEGVIRSREKIREFYDKDDIEPYRAEYAERRGPEDPQKLEDYLAARRVAQTSRMTIEHLLEIIQSERISNAIMNMEWAMAKLRAPRFPLLTSDRPIAMSNGLAFSHSHIAMPISPTHVFVASNSDDTTSQIREMARDGSLVTKMNDLVARQARRFVFGLDDSQLRFVENRLGEMKPCTPIG